MIRPYRDTDRDAVEAIYLDSFPGYGIGLLHEHLAKASGVWVMVQDAGARKVIGYLLMEGSYLSQVAVHPKHRRKGIGRGLIKYAEKQCRNKRTWLHVLASNPAVKLYEKLGYKITETHDALYGAGNPGFVMKLAA